jgi:uncharacterized protein YbbC (DUF1343 family)
MIKNSLFVILLLLNSALHSKEVIVGAQRINHYLPLLQGKSVGLVVNQTSMVGKTHVVDTLLSLGIDIQLIFAPEHGFRGTADAGEHIDNGLDPKTQLPIVSLYGDNKKPTPGQLKDLDVLVFDIQDVGVRFYTYISTLHYLMEACAEQNKPLIVLDRPNPNGHYVDGPILEKQYSSFVGMDPIPVVHGMTVGEYARMLNGQNWLNNRATCDLTVITCLNYDHKTFYTLPVKPSPNLPNMSAVYLYPSLCFFEGTNSVSLGRGTDLPFQVYGSNQFPKNLPYSFLVESKPGAKNPPLLGQTCFGYDLSSIPLDSLRKQKFTLKYLLHAYQLTTDKNNFLNDFFIKLAGTNSLPDLILQNKDEKSIRMSWGEELCKFKAIRKKYLLYKDFE